MDGRRQSDLPTSLREWEELVLEKMQLPARQTLKDGRLVKAREAGDLLRTIDDLRDATGWCRCSREELKEAAKLRNPKLGNLKQLDRTLVVLRGWKVIEQDTVNPKGGGRSCGWQVLFEPLRKLAAASIPPWPECRPESGRVAQSKVGESSTLKTEKWTSRPVESGRVAQSKVGESPTSPTEIESLKRQITQQLVTADESVSPDSAHGLRGRPDVQTSTNVHNERSSMDVRTSSADVGSLARGVDVADVASEAIHEFNKLISALGEPLRRSDAWSLVVGFLVGPLTRAQFEGIVESTLAAAERAKLDGVPFNAWSYAVESFRIQVGECGLEAAIAAGTWNEQRQMPDVHLVPVLRRKLQRIGVRWNPSWVRKRREVLD